MAVLGIAVIQQIHNDDDQLHLRAEIYGTVLGRNDFQCVVNNIDAEGSLNAIRASIEASVKNYLVNDLGITFLPSDTVKCL